MKITHAILLVNRFAVVLLVLPFSLNYVDWFIGPIFRPVQRLWRFLCYHP